MLGPNFSDRDTSARCWTIPTSRRNLFNFISSWSLTSRPLAERAQCRQSIKKYVLANNKIAPASTNAFDSQFNKAIKAGVEKGEFTQPKGPSGPVKLAKKEAAPKPAAKSTTAAKPKKATATTTKKAEKAEKAEKPKTTTKKTGTTTTTKKSVGRPKANTAKPRKASTTVIGKTKSGRVTKTTAKPAEKATKKSTKKA
ncbi:unnamed protein product [Aspergillus oryzae]|uniref:Histone H1 n=1 Tax=Aspergillus oryzae var. brunneus TaxID=332754 RepID=A0ABQ6KFR8_ASPOZ|nr:unnamed protein product [Aspergillus oryzae]GMF93022.1 unnamed protein product [Aspergillus oryzae]GMG41118.1 unnamed protein product [Aspergillus oryzae var. brunneus]